MYPREGSDRREATSNLGTLEPSASGKNYIFAILRKAGRLRCGPGEGPSLPGFNHCGLPAAVKEGVGERAADHHSGASVVTIINLSSCLGHRAAQLYAKAFYQGDHRRRTGGGQERGGTSGKYGLHQLLPGLMEPPYGNSKARNNRIDVMWS